MVSILGCRAGCGGGLGGTGVPLNDAVAQQTNENTFRLLTFQVGNSGPRLGTTRGNGQEDIVDVHNAILYLVKAGAPEVSGLAPIPIDMRSLIEAGDASVSSVRTVHETITRLRSSGSFTDPGGDTSSLPSTRERHLPSSHHQPLQDRGGGRCLPAAQSGWLGR